MTLPVSVLALATLLAVAPAPDSLHLRFAFTASPGEASCCCPVTPQAAQVPRVRTHYRVLTFWPAAWQPVREDSIETDRGARVAVDVRIPARHTWADDSTARMVQFATTRWSRNLAAVDSSGITVLRRVSLVDCRPWRRTISVRPAP